MNAAYNVFAQSTQLPPDVMVPVNISKSLLHDAEKASIPI